MIEYVPYILMVISILFINKVRISLTVLLISIVSGLFLKRIDLITLPVISLMGLLAWLPSQKERHRLLKGVSLIFFGILAIATMNHLLPGFNNLPIYQKVQFSADTIPFSMYLNFDKALIGYFLCLFFINSYESQKLNIDQFLITIKNFVLLILVILPIGILIGFVRFDFKLPHLGIVWMLNNLFFVCLAEEGFYRGFLQNIFMDWLPKNKLGQLLAIVFAALFFGLSHFKGGAIYSALAVLAGLFYGYTYYQTKRLETAILIHFAFNLFHFLFLSYPALS